MTTIMPFNIKIIKNLIKPLIMNNPENYGIEFNPKKPLSAHLQGSNSTINLTCVNTIKQAVIELKTLFSGKVIDVDFYQNGEKVGSLFIDCTL